MQLRVQRAALALVVGSVLPLAARAQAVPFDDLKDRSLHWNAHLVTPLLLSADETELYGVNQGGQRLAILDTATFLKKADIPVGPGVVSMALRPGTTELWLVDKVTSSVFVVGTKSLRIQSSIRVGAEPHGIAFTPSGDRAYVACSGVDRVDVIDAATLSVATSIPIPAKNPRAVVVHGGVAWVLPLLSGNNTAPMGAAASGPDVDRVVEVRSLADFPALNQLPDRDLLAIPTQPTPAQDALDPGQTRTGLGTLQFNLHARPGTNELWVPNTEALNAVHKGEKNFVAGQCVDNRITIVDALGAVPPRFVELDELAPAGVKCAQPTGLAFDPIRSRVYVCGYGSDRVAVLDTSSPLPTWIGAIDIPFAGVYPEQSGPRTCVVDAAGDWLYVLNKGNASVTRINLAQLPAAAPFLVTAPSPRLLGRDLVSGVERFGRNDLVDAKNSKSGTTSCASCHVDGHTDGLAWNLGGFMDPEGTANEALAFPLDDKGPLVTQSVRQLFGTGPYHWRGERSNLFQFDQAFIDLMEREEGGVPTKLGAHFSYLQRYMQRVAHVPNARQEPDRSLTQEQQAGATLFTTKPVLGQMTCATCHTLPLGTSGELVSGHAPGMFDVAVVPQLRGVADKLAPPFTIGGEFGTRTELGAGLSHGGAFATVQDLLLAPHPTQPGQTVFGLTPAEADSIAAFLEAFDTGLAPSAGFQATANTSNAATIQTQELAYLIAEAQAGRCDLVYRASPRPFAGQIVWPSGLFDPATGDFEVAEAGAPRMTVQALINEASAGRPVTFIGVPRWMGLPMALDRDLDRLYDLDERLAGTDVEKADTDVDGFPDGYEVLYGMDPLLWTGSSPDKQAPSAVSISNELWATSNSIKFEFETDEPCQAVVFVNGKAVQRLPLHEAFDFQFSVVLERLEPGKTHAVQLMLTDPSKNVGMASTTLDTRPAAFPTPTSVADIDLVVQHSPSTGPVLDATLTLVAGSAPPVPGYVVDVDVYFEADHGVRAAVATGLHQTLTATDGVLNFQVPLFDADFGRGRVVLVVRSITAPQGAPPYARALNLETWDAVTWN